MEREIVKVGEDWGLTFDIKEEEEVAKKEGVSWERENSWIMQREVRKPGAKFWFSNGLFQQRVYK